LAQFPLSGEKENIYSAEPQRYNYSQTYQKLNVKPIPLQSQHPQISKTAIKIKTGIKTKKKNSNTAHYVYILNGSAHFHFQVTTNGLDSYH
jgi:hypothetical protein